MAEPVKYDRNGRRQYQHIDRKIRRTLQARGDDCGICGQPIDYDLPQYHPLSFEVDHVLPISLGGTKTIDNSRASHRHCNRQRSNNLDADAIAAGATAPTTTSTRPTATGCPTVGPCRRCRGTHHAPESGTSFITSRKWSPHGQAHALPVR